MQPTPVVVTISGRDRPGVTASLFAALAAHDVEVRDVEQVVIRERLILAVLLDLHGDPAALRNSVSQAAHALGMESEVAVAAPEAATRAVNRFHVIVMGQPLRPGALSHVAQLITDVGGNIESVALLASEPATSFEMNVRAPDAAVLRATLIAVHEETGLDVGVEPAVLRRRAKRLVVLDVDSTLIRDEAMGALAARAGVADETAAITARTLTGELDFATAVRERVALLAGLTTADLDAVRDELRLMPGARTFVRTLRRLGYYVGVVSGGFSFVTDRFDKELSLDFAAANELEVVDGVVTGRMLGPILDRRGKADALRRFAGQFDVPLSQTVAVGEGSSDIDLLETAGLGVAFNARSALRNASGDESHLDNVLFVLGISGDDVQEATDDDLVS
ncbi:MAG TPA: phosphoserine phosphatase SerB [Jatrophihabitans sp.]|jgi:phosphoserine phosphatase|nr:phosphoserine phosphatase SerB [Jatrophihabitans sp.]